MARARGKKVLTGIAVEVHEPRGLGRCRMSPLADASAETLHAFVMDHVEPGSTIITDGWPAYQGLAQLGYEHDRRSQGAARARGDDPNKLLPAVHRVVSLAKAEEAAPRAAPNGEGIPRAWNAQGQTGRGGRRPNTDGGRDALRLNGYPQGLLFGADQ